MTFDENLANWRSLMSYQTGLLALVGLLTSAALTLANQSTEKPIADSLQKDLQASLAQVLPAGSFDNDLIASTQIVGTRTVYVAKKAGQITGLVFETSGKGYAGAIRLVMGIDPAGKVLGVRVLTHAETPGLGDKIDAQKSDWIQKFAGKTLTTAKWAVKKDGGEFDQFAGATITPRAVVNAVHEGLQWYDKEKTALLQGAAK